MDIHERQRMEDDLDQANAEIRRFDADMEMLKIALNKADKVWIDRAKRARLLCLFGRLVCYSGAACLRTGQLFLKPETVIGLLDIAMRDQSGALAREAEAAGGKILRQMRPWIRDKVDRDAGPLLGRRSPG